MKTKEQLIKVFEEVIEDIISREYEYKDCLLYTSDAADD